MSKELTIVEISKKLKLNSSTLRTWLGNFRFDKYRVAQCYPATYVYSKSFLIDLKKYIDRKPSTAARKLYNSIDKLLKGEEQ